MTGNVFARAASLFLTAAISCSAPNNARPNVSAPATRFSAVLPILSKAYEAYDKRRFNEAADLFREGLTDVVHSPSLFETGACAATLVGRRDEAFSYLERMLLLGVPDPTSFVEEANLRSLHDDPRWSSLVARARAKAPSMDDPERSHILTEDVSRFWRAYDEAAHSSEIRVVFDRLYVDTATPAAQFFLAAKVNSTDALVQSLREHPRYYASVRANTMHVSERLPEIRAVFHRLHQVLPEATFPDLTFVVGRLHSAGTAGIEGLMLGVEQLSRDDATPLEELGAEGPQRAIKCEGLSHIVAHELAHFQQHFGKCETLLCNALLEGGAELVAEVVSGAVGNPTLAAYGDSHEHELWIEFRRAMSSSDSSEWLYNHHQVKARPADLGYYVGYRITKSYYERAGDKTAALRAILNIQDSPAFLVASGYAP